MKRKGFSSAYEGLNETGSRESSPAVIKTIADYAEVPLEMIAENAVRAIIERAKGRSEERFRSRFQLNPERDFENALRECAEQRLRKYKEEIVHKTASFADQFVYSIGYANERNYIRDDPGFKIIIVDEFLHYGIGKSVTPANSFDINKDVIFVGIDQPNGTLAHELGHALAAEQMTKDGEIRYSGFGRFNTLPDGTLASTGGNWFDEGVTTLWQMSTTQGEGSAPSHEYEVFAKVAELLLEKCGIKKDFLFRAYFGDAKARNILNENIHLRFGCTLEHLLDILMVKIDFDFIKKVLNGERVEVRLREGEPPSVAKTELARLFSNVVLERV